MRVLSVLMKHADLLGSAAATEPIAPSGRNCIAIGNGDPEFNQVPVRTRNDQIIVDLVAMNGRRSEEGGYDGICW